MGNLIRQKLREELSKEDKDYVKKELDKSIDSKALKDMVEKIVIDRVKKDKEIEDYIVDITSNVLTQLYKSLWVKRNFWKNNLSNKAS